MLNDDDPLNAAYAEGRKDQYEEDMELLELLSWAYGKLNVFSYTKQEDALMLDRIKLLLTGASLC